MEQLKLRLNSYENIMEKIIKGEAIPLHVEFYSSFPFNFNFDRHEARLVKSSWNQGKEKFDFLHFYLTSSIKTESPVGFQWRVKVRTLKGNLLIGICSSLSTNSVDFVINRFGEIKKKESNENKYKLIRKVQSAVGRATSASAKATTSPSSTWPSGNSSKSKTKPKNWKPASRPSKSQKLEKISTASIASTPPMTPYNSFDHYPISLLVPLMPTLHASVKQRGRLVRTPRLPLLVVGLLAPAAGTQHSSHGQVLGGLVLLHHFQFLLLGVLDDCLLLTHEGVVVPAELADESVPSGGTLDQQQFEAEGTKFHGLIKERQQ